MAGTMRLGLVALHLWLSACAAEVGAPAPEVTATAVALTPSPAEQLPMAAYTPCMYLKDQNTWSSAHTHANTIGTRIALSTILNNGSSELNRISTVISSSRRPGHPAGSWKYGFEWDGGDQAVKYWVPQGMALSSHSSIYDAFVGWYWKSNAGNPAPIGFSDKGVRVSIVNLMPIFSSPAVAPRYRHALLVRPTGTRAYVPVENHAGGIVVRGNHLYLADTSNGIRVFNLDNIREVNNGTGCSDRLGYHLISGISTPCAFGYKYVIPQISHYTPARSDGTALPTSNACFAKFSFLGEDTTQATDVVLSGEYCNPSDAPCNTTPSDTGGRLFRWPIDAASGRLALCTTCGGVANLVKASKAYTMNKRNVQGVAPVPQTSFVGDYRLSSSRAGGSLQFATTTSAPYQAYSVDDDTWSYYPEGLHASETGSGNLWVDTEGRTDEFGNFITNPAEGGRAVYALDSNLLHY